MPRTFTTLTHKAAWRQLSVGKLGGSETIVAVSITGVCFGAISFNFPLARTIRFGSVLPTKSWHRDATSRINGAER